MKLKLIIFVYLTLATFQLFANYKGAQITWKAINSNGDFEITLTEYISCRSYCMPILCGTNCTKSITLKYEDAALGLISNGGNITLSLVSREHVGFDTLLCNSQQNKPKCVLDSNEMIGNYEYGYVKYVYKAVYNLLMNMQQSAKYSRLIYNENTCYSYFSLANITNNSTGIIRVEALINVSLATQSLVTSPQFGFDPYFIMPSKWSVKYNPGVNDSDGDSLLHQLGKFTPINVTYALPFSQNSPLPWTGAYSQPFPNGFHFDEQTGELAFKSPYSSTDSELKFPYGHFVYKLRYNAIKLAYDTVGFVQRINPFAIVPSPITNHIPAIQLSNLNNTKIGISNDSSQIELMAGDTLQLLIKALDADLNDTTLLSWIQNTLPLGMQIQNHSSLMARRQNGTRHDSIILYWIPTDTLIRNKPYVLHLKATDNRCPEKGINSVAFRFLVRNKIRPVIVKHATCSKIRFSQNTNSNTQFIKEIFHNNLLVSTGIHNDTLEYNTNNKGKYLLKLTAQYGTIQMIMFDSIEITHMSAIGSLISSPTDSAICLSKPIALTIQSSDSINHQYTWYKNNLPLTQNSNQLVFTEFNLIDTGTYKIKISSQCDEFHTPPFRLTSVSIPSINFTSQSINKCIGEQFDLNAFVQSKMPATYIWKLNDSIIHLGSSSISVAKIESKHSGKYVLQATNFCGTGISPLFELRVFPQTEIRVLEENQVFVCNDKSVLLNAIITDTSILDYKQWFFNGQPIQGANTQQLFIQHFNQNQSGNYYIRAKGLCDTTQSNFVQVLMHSTTSIQPIATNSIALCNGSTFSITPTIIGMPLSFVWMKNGRELEINHGQNLMINKVGISDTGNYTLIAHSKCDTAYSEQINLQLKPRVFARISTLDTMFCNTANIELINYSLSESGSFTFKWLLPNNATNESSNIITNTHPSPGNFIYKLVVKNNENCIDTAIQIIAVGQPIAISQITGNRFVESGIIENYEVPHVIDYKYRWELSKGTILSGQNTNRIQVKWENNSTSQSDKISVIIQGNGSCSTQVNLDVYINSSNTSQKESSPEIKTIHMYPNPAHEKLFIEKVPLCQISITDVRGKVLSKHHVESNTNTIELDLNKFATGLYFIVFENNQQVVTRKLIIE